MGLAPRLCRLRRRKEEQKRGVRTAGDELGGWLRGGGAHELCEGKDGGVGRMVSEEARWIEQLSRLHTVPDENSEGARVTNGR